MAEIVPSRRAFLGAATFGINVAVAGCSGASRERVRTCVTPDPESHVDDWHGQDASPTRGGASPVEIPYSNRRDPSRREVRTVESAETVRAEYEGREVDWRTIEEWSTVDCGTTPECVDAVTASGNVVAALNLVLTDRLDADVGAGTSRGRGSEYHATVTRTLILGCEGDVVSAPTVGFEALHGATPRTVFTVKTTDEVVLVCETPVYVRDVLLQEET